MYVYQHYSSLHFSNNFLHRQQATLVFLEYSPPPK